MRLVARIARRKFPCYYLLYLLNKLVRLDVSLSNRVYEKLFILNPSNPEPDVLNGLNKTLTGNLAKRLFKRQEK